MHFLKNKKFEFRKIYAMCSVISIISFLGFIIENIWLFTSQGYMSNRNMVLPFLLGYGLAVAAIYGMFGTPIRPRFFAIQLDTGKKPLNFLIYWIFSCICVMGGELILGHLVEAMTGIVWWNYTNLPLHITKYTSLTTGSVFALMITVFMAVFFTPIHKKFESTDKRVIGAASVILVILMSLDFINSGLYMLIKRKTLKLWRIDFKASLIEMIKKLF